MTMLICGKDHRIIFKTFHCSHFYLNIKGNTCFEEKQTSNIAHTFTILSVDNDNCLQNCISTDTFPGTCCAGGAVTVTWG